MSETQRDRERQSDRERDRDREIERDRDRACRMHIVQNVHTLQCSYHGGIIKWSGKGG